MYRDLYKNGGIPYQTRSLVNALGKIGHDLTTISCNSHLDKSPEILPHGIRSIFLSSGLKGLKEFRAVLHKCKPDIVHITGMWIPIHQLWTLEISRADIPYVISTHGNLSPLGMNVRFGEKSQLLSRIWAKKLWHKIFDLPLLRHAQGIHVHSIYEQDLLKASGFQNVFVVPNGIESDWVGTHDGRPRIRHQPITFLHLGRLDIYHKGLDIICDALEKCKKKGINKKMKVIFVGPTVNDSSLVLKRLASKLGDGLLEVRDAVHGKEKEDLFDETDYFFNLYRFAGMAIAPSEALAKGIPLVATREGHFGDWVDESGFGYRVPLDGESLFRTINVILDSSIAHYQSLSEQALRFSRTYSWDKVAADLIHVYQQAHV